MVNHGRIGKRTGDSLLSRPKAMREAIMLAGPAGRLEGLLDEPRQTAGPGVAVLCHPHPLHHGTMLNKVLHAVARAINELGLPAVRFNFRGVGASDGEYGGGIGETEDTLAVAAWAKLRYSAGPLWLCGFSFGAMVACRAALAERPAQLVTIAPPVNRMADLLGGAQPDCPWLILQGEADDIVSCDDVVNWVNQLAPGPELVILRDVGHFFHGRLTLLRQALVERLGRAESAV
jgi:alpha/beta superfamily hydrolase